MSKESSSGIGFFGLLGAFIVLKLCNVINWSWWYVTAPIWGPIPLALLIVFLGIYWERRAERKREAYWKKREESIPKGSSKKSRFMMRLEEAMQKQKEARDN